MRIIAAQPLMTGPHGGHLEPTPLLSLSEAEAEAAALQSDPATFTLEPLGEIPLDFLGPPIGRLLIAGKLEAYTHRLTVMEAPEYVCRDYLVRVE